MNTQSTQNAQLAANAAAPPRPPVHHVTPAARLANAKLVTVNKTTTSGATLILATPQALAPDCTPLGRVDVKIITPPEHGNISIADVMAFSNFTPADPPFLCNARKSPATRISYQSAAGFTGQDTAAVQIFFPDGHAPTLLFHVDVR